VAGTRLKGDVETFGFCSFQYIQHCRRTTALFLHMTLRHESKARAEKRKGTDSHVEAGRVSLHFSLDCRSVLYRINWENTLFRHEHDGTENEIINSC